MTSPFDILVNYQERRGVGGGGEGDGGMAEGVLTTSVAFIHTFIDAVRLDFALL